MVLINPNIIDVFGKNIKISYIEMLKSQYVAIFRGGGANGDCRNQGITDSQRWEVADCGLSQSAACQL